MITVILVLALIQRFWKIVLSGLTVSFGVNTIFGSPGVYGGYGYTPLEMQARTGTSMVEKHNESLLLLPKLLHDYGYEVTITDPPLANYRWVSDLRIFADYPEIHAENIIGKYTKQWLDFLKENDVYNNSRIIIVSDHGNRHIRFPNDIVLPKGELLQSYSPILMVKDFDSGGVLSINDSFMTNADVPLIVLKDIIENPVNPWTGKLLEADKKNGITVTMSKAYHFNMHQKYRFNIKPDEWLHVHTDIYKSENWSGVKF